MVWNNDPRRVNGGKEYGAVDRLDCSVVDWRVDRVYQGPDDGYKQHALLLALILILIVSRAAQYMVDGGLRFRRELWDDNYSFNRRGNLSYVDRLPNIPYEVVGLD